VKLSCHKLPIACGSRGKADCGQEYHFPGGSSDIMQGERICTESREGSIFISFLSPGSSSADLRQCFARLHLDRVIVSQADQFLRLWKGSSVFLG